MLICTIILQIIAKKIAGTENITVHMNPGIQIVVVHQVTGVYLGVMHKPRGRFFGLF